MITLVPLSDYSLYYYVTMLCFIVFFSVQVFAGTPAAFLQTGSRNEAMLFLARACVLFMIVFLGLRPISWVFGDMWNYNKMFLLYANGAQIKDQEAVFSAGLWIFANYSDAHVFFFLCLVGYVLSIVVACRRFLGNYWPYGFFFSASIFDFYGYAVNGIRQGLASSLFLLALSSRKPVSWLIAAAAMGIHSSLLLPMMAYLLSTRFRDVRWYFIGWIACLGATLLSGAIGEQLATLGIVGGRLDAYLVMEEALLKQFSSIGFRVDFLIYSMIPIVLGYYFLITKRVSDPVYTHLVSIYLTCNAVWLLAIRIPASNRIAYLSWFMTGVLVAYPLVKFPVSKNQNITFGALLIVVFAHTFLTNVILR